MITRVDTTPEVINVKQLSDWCGAQGVRLLKVSRPILWEKRPYDDAKGKIRPDGKYLENGSVTVDVPHNFDLITFAQNLAKLECTEPVKRDVIAEKVQQALQAALPQFVEAVKESLSQGQGQGDLGGSSKK